MRLEKWFLVLFVSTLFGCSLVKKVTVDPYLATQAPSDEVVVGYLNHLAENGEWSDRNEKHHSVYNQLFQYIYLEKDQILRAERVLYSSQREAFFYEKKYLDINMIDSSTITIDTTGNKSLPISVSMHCFQKNGGKQCGKYSNSGVRGKYSAGRYVFARFGSRTVADKFVATIKAWLKKKQSSGNDTIENILRKHKQTAMSGSSLTISNSILDNSILLAIPVVDIFTIDRIKKEIGESASICSNTYGGKEYTGGIGLEFDDSEIIKEVDLSEIEKSFVSWEGNHKVTVNDFLKPSIIHPYQTRLTDANTLVCATRKSEGYRYHYMLRYWGGIRTSFNALLMTDAASLKKVEKSFLISEGKKYQEQAGESIATAKAQLGDLYGRTSSEGVDMQVLLAKPEFSEKFRLTVLLANYGNTAKHFGFESLGGITDSKGRVFKIIPAGGSASRVGVSIGQYCVQDGASVLLNPGVDCTVIFSISIPGFLVSDPRQDSKTLIEIDGNNIVLKKRSKYDLRIQSLM